MAALNLVVPGLGLVLIGWPVTGMVIGVVFVLCANFALAGAFLFPEDIPRRWVLLSAGAAGGAYVAAQLQMSAAMQAARRTHAERLRRRALHEAAIRLQQGDAPGALAALQPLAGQECTDLLVAYRRAQVLASQPGAAQARAAWVQVQRLDRHGFYRAEVAAGLQRLNEAAGAAQLVQSAPGRRGEHLG